jgi:aldehyde dehydrogenase (NAD(P)+)
MDYRSAMETARTDTAQMDSALADLAESKDRWANLPIAQKLPYLDSIKRNTVKVARRWVEAATKAKGLSMDHPLAGEEWTSGPFMVLWPLPGLRTTLVRLSSGVPVLEGFETGTGPDGQVVVDVYPKSFDEMLLFAGLTAQTWMQPDVTFESLEESTAAFYRQEDPAGAVAVVLGAGNIASIAVLDAVYALFNQGRVVVLKMNPVNDYLGPFFEEVFEDLIADGYVRFAYGGTDVGHYLTTHPLVDMIHITGSVDSFNAIVYGTGDEGEANRLADRPTNPRHIEAELGGVGCVLVVPGKWSAKDIRFQAEHIVSYKMHNSGFNCVAAQVLVVADDWDQKDDLLNEIRAVLSEIDDRDPYYPGSKARCLAAVEGYETADSFGGDGHRHLVTGLDAEDESEPFFSTEIFGPVLTVTSLPTSGPEEFLAEAVAFANDRLYGSLGANIIIDPKTARSHDAALERGIADLRYGTVTVNAWSGVAYFMTRSTWGAFPGHPMNDIQSGRGVVHNTLMFDKAEKTVVRGPFAEAQRAMLKREFHLSPKMVYFVTNKQAHVVGEKLIDYCDAPSKLKLMSIASSALRG